MYKVVDIFHSLEGKWHLERDISNFALISGIASFNYSKFSINKLLYREDVEFALIPGNIIKAYREYEYELHNNKIRVFFIKDKIPDKLFYILKFSKEVIEKKVISATGLHNCINDTYFATYNFYNKDEFSLLLNVSGPNKNYYSTSNFSRIVG